MKQGVKCPKCEKNGRFEKASGKSYRINHDVTKNGKRTTNRCFLGNPFDIIEKLRNISKIRSDLANTELADKVLTELKKDKKSDRLLLEILELNRKLGFGWKDETHDLVKQDSCPHCKEKIAVRYRRIGLNPNNYGGKYNIEKFEIKKGEYDKTSRFFFPSGKLRNQWERGVEKGNPKERDFFFEDPKS